MLDFYMEKVLANRADNGELSAYSENLLAVTAQLAMVIQARAVMKLASCAVPLLNGETAINTYDTSRCNN